MRLEVGKFYKTRDGRKAWVICKSLQSGLKPGFHIAMVDVISTTFIDVDGFCGLDRRWDLVSEWTEDDEPRAKVKMWQWVVTVVNALHKENHYLTTKFYPNQEEAAKAHDDWIKIRKADWTEIEVEQ